MTFQVGQRVKTRGGGWASVECVWTDGKCMAEHEDGVNRMHEADGQYLTECVGPRDLLPGAIEDEVDETLDRFDLIARELTARGYLKDGRMAHPTPGAIDQDWKDDARAALTGLLASGKVSPEYLRLNIPVYIEILASLRATERARRKEAGE